MNPQVIQFLMTPIGKTGGSTLAILYNTGQLFLTSGNRDAVSWNEVILPHEDPRYIGLFDSAHGRN